MSTELVVEDGSGIPGADSYNSIAELDAYMQKFDYASWPISEQEAPPPSPDPDIPSPEDPDQDQLFVDNSESEDEESGNTGEEGSPGSDIVELSPEDAAILRKKQAAARKAALYIDSKYGVRFTGFPTNPDQGLAWPRENAITYYGRPIDKNVIPIALKNAHAEVSRLAFEGIQLSQQTSAGPLLTRKKVDVLEWEWDVNTYNEAPVFGWVDQLLEPLLGPAEQVGALDILGVIRA